VLAVADVWDALTSTRPYRKAFTLNAALEVIRDGAGTHFDPQIVSVVLPYLESLAVESRDTPDDAATETRQKDPTPAAARA
jgi:putative two-component system response regulator